jgi:hypothetical protein
MKYILNWRKMNSGTIHCIIKQKEKKERKVKQEKKRISCREKDLFLYMAASEFKVSI